MSGLHFEMIRCPECDGNEVYDMAADDAPAFSLECQDCGYVWSTVGFAFTITESDEVEGYSRDG